MYRLLLDCLLLLTGAAQVQQLAHRARTSRYHRATPVHATQLTAGRKLTCYCASGNTVRYHSSSTCRGFNRYSASAPSLVSSEARAQMETCQIYHWYRRANLI